MSSEQLAEKYLTAHQREEIDHWLAKYPDDDKGRRSAVIPALHIAQEGNGGWLSRELIDAVAEYLGLPTTKVYEVATFYSMFDTSPVGRHKVNVCTNVSCMLRGGEELLAHIEERLGITVGETTADGRVTLKHEDECLAGCTGAPMMLVDEVYHTNLTPEKVDEILENLE
ncbi:NADH-quinone oxidoreductase subunit E [wastewater metagenome]|uniref:NADH-quinone oxidoreductase subunit E n=2 Tax=unclassified sequences TaxID=12908 RepID=A0A5B8R5H3_9ZZZZ|nr:MULTISPECIES: NADH-quinone oxidoreductase subunit NuoE [Arhodomonas]MCS4504674.1 NADH-quinone oxidoreductase subunit NuoE [Arhodomonas aquaeolei]QEA04059.1 NADH-quinone oxidoreductase subunit E [uncultured organism]